MFFIEGKQKVIIKEYIEFQQFCKSCKATDLTVTIYRGYWHVYLIPVFPVGKKTSQISCNKCGKTMYLESLQSHYKQKTRTPLYFYSVPILIFMLIIDIVFLIKNNNKDVAFFVTHPKNGDVYSIKENFNDSTFYHFFKIVDIKGDSVIAFTNRMEYPEAQPRLAPGDYYDKNKKIHMLKSKLIEMYDNSEISSIRRDED